MISTKRIATITVLGCLIFAVMLLVPLFDSAIAQSPPPDLSKLDPDAVAIIRALDQASKGSSSSDWTSTGVFGLLATAITGFLTWFMKNGGFVVTWRLHEEDRTSLKEIATMVKEAVPALKDTLESKHLLVEIKTKVDTHVDEIASLRQLKHDLPDKLTPILLSVSRIEGVLDGIEKTQQVHEKPKASQRS